MARPLKKGLVYCDFVYVIKCEKTLFFAGSLIRLMIMTWSTWSSNYTLINDGQNTLCGPKTINSSKIKYN